MKLDANTLQSLLVSVSDTLKISLEEVEALYVYYGEDLFFLLHLLSGKTIHFPSKSPVVSFFDRIKDFQILDLKGFTQLVEPDCLVSPKLLKPGEKFIKDNKEYTVVGNPVHFEEHYLVMVKSIIKGDKS